MYVHPDMFSVCLMLGAMTYEVILVVVYLIEKGIAIILVLVIIILSIVGAISHGLRQRTRLVQ